MATNLQIGRFVIKGKKIKKYYNMSFPAGKFEEFPIEVPPKKEKFDLFEDVELLKKMQRYVELKNFGTLLPGVVEEIKNLNIVVDNARMIQLIDNIVDYTLCFNDAHYPVLEAVQEMSCNDKEVMKLFLQRYVANIQVSSDQLMKWNKRSLTGSGHDAWISAAERYRLQQIEEGKSVFVDLLLNINSRPDYFADQMAENFWVKDPDDKNLKQRTGESVMSDFLFTTHIYPRDNTLQVINEEIGDMKVEDILDYIQENKEQFLYVIQEQKDVKKKMELIKLSVLQGQGDVILSNIFSFDLSDDLVEDVLLFLVELDPELMLHSIDNVDLKEHPLFEDIVFELTMYSPYLMVGKLNDLSVNRIELYEKVIDKDPRHFLQNFDSMMTGGKVPFSKKDKQLFEQQLVESLRGVYSGKFVRTINELSDIVVDSDVVRDVIFELRSEALVDVGKDLFQYIVEEQKKAENPSMMQLGKHTDNMMNFIRNSLGIKTHILDVIAVAALNDDSERMMMISEDDDSYEDDVSFKYWCLGYYDDYGIEKNKFDPVSSDTIKFVLQQLFVEGDVNLLQSGLERFSKAGKVDSWLQPVIEETFEYLIENPSGDFGYYDLLSNIDEYNISAKKKKTLIVKIVQETPTVVSWRFLKENNKMLTDNDRVNIFDAIIEINPYSLADMFKHLKFDNERTVYEMVRRAINEGREPFSFFKTPGDALRVLQLNNSGSIWKPGVSPDKRTGYIDKWQEIRSIASEKTWEYIQEHTYDCEYDFDVLRLSVDNIKAMNIVINEHADWLDILGEEDKKGSPRPTRRLQLFFGLNPSNYHLLELLVDDYNQLKNGLSVKEPFFNKKMPTKELPYPLMSTERYQYFLLARQLQKPLLEVIDLVEELRDEMAPRGVSRLNFLDFLTYDDDVIKRYNFLVKNKKNLQRWAEQANFLFDTVKQDHEMVYPLVVDDVFHLPSAVRRDFLETEIDFESVSKGFLPKHVFKMILLFQENIQFALDDPEEIKLFSSYIGEFGLWDDPMIYREYRNLKQGGEMSQTFVDLGVRNIPAVEGESDAEAKRRGNQVLNSFRGVMRGLRDSFIFGREDEVPEAFYENDIALGIIKNYSNYAVSEWSRSRDIGELVAVFRDFQRRGLVKPLSAEYQEGTIEVKEKISTDDEDNNNEKFAISVEATNKFSVFVGDAKAVQSVMMEYGHNYKDGLVDKCSVVIDDYITQLSQKKNRFDLELNLEKRERKIRKTERETDKLEELKAMLKSGSVDPLEVLIEFELNNKVKKTHPVTTFFIRRFVLMRAFEDDGKLESNFSQFIKDGELTVGNIPVLSEVINNRLLQHVVPAFGFDKKMASKLKAVFNTTVIDSEIKRINEISSEKTSSFACVPSRGVLGELSGYYCDACWTSRDSIMKDYPNITSYAFINNPDDLVNRNIAGGTLVIESAINGEKTLIIRGFNPQQNTLTNNNAADFVESFIDNKLIEDARRLGVKNIVAPIFSLGALSNREEVLSHFKEKYGDAERVEFDEKVDFNGYNITKACVVLRTLE